MVADGSAAAKNASLMTVIRTATTGTLAGLRGLQAGEVERHVSDAAQPQHAQRIEVDGVLPDDVEEALDRVERRGRVRRDGDHVDRRGTCVEERGRLSSRGVRIARRLSILGKCELRLPSIDDAGERGQKMNGARFVQLSHKG